MILEAFVVGRSAVIAAIEEDFELRHPGYHKSRRGGLTTLADVMLEVRSGNLMELAAALPRDIGTWANGDKYVGEFTDDKANGQGTITYPNGDKYVGEWRDDKMHGQGTYTYASGIKYVGEFRDDKRHGQGTMYAPGGTVLQNGIWHDDELVAKR